MLAACNGGVPGRLLGLSTELVCCRRTSGTLQRGSLQARVKRSQHTVQN